MVKLMLVLPVGFLAALAAVSAAGLRTPASAPAGNPSINLPTQSKQLQPKIDKPVLDLHGNPLPKGAVARLGSAWFRHEARLSNRELVYSPNGKLLAAGTEDGIVLWDAATGKELRHLPAENDAAFDFAPDAKTLVINSGNVTLLQIDTGREVFKVTPSGGRSVTAQQIRFSGDGKTLAVRFLYQDTLESVLLLLDANTGKQRARLIDLPSPGRLAIAPDGRTLAAASEAAVHFYDLASDRLVRTMQLNREPAFSSIAFSPDGRTLARATARGLELIELASSQVRAMIHLKSDWLGSVAFLPDGRTVMASEGDTATTHFWDVQTGKQRRELHGATGLVYRATLSPDGKTLAAETYHGSAVRLWDVASVAEKLPLHGHDMPILSVAFAPEGKQVVTGGDNEHVHLWDAATGKHLLQFKGIDAHGVAFSPDGSKLAAVGPQPPEVQYAFACIWDAATAKRLLGVRSYKNDSFECLAFFPDGRRLATGNYNCISVWDAEKGKLLKRIELGKIYHYSLAVAHDGKLLAVGGEALGGSEKDQAFLQLLDVDGSSKPVTLQGHQDVVTSVAFSPDGTLLASASMDKTVRLWNVADGKEVRNLVGHERAVAAVAISPDGRVLASADGLTASSRRLPMRDFKVGANEIHRIRLWDIATGQELRSLQGHDVNVTSLAFSPDSTRLVSGHGDGTALVWDVR